MKYIKAPNHLGSFASDPSFGTAGNTYWNTSSSVLKVYNGSSWTSITGGGGGGSASWGDISGTLSNQTDLNSALSGKEPSISAGTTSQYWRGDKSFQTLDKTAVGLANVDNTSDANKPVSTAQQTALNLKANLTSPALTGTPTAPTASVGTNTTQLATTAFVISEIGSQFSTLDAMRFKGFIDCSSNPNYPSANAGEVYKASVAGKIGGASGVNVEVGDLITCLVDATASGDHATVGANWNVTQTNVDGAVTGQSSSVDNEIALFSGSSGKVIKRLTGTGIMKVNSGVADIVSALAQSEVTNLVSDLAGKQATLVSATNIKTVNGNSLLGSGDLTISGGGNTFLDNVFRVQDNSDNTKQIAFEASGITSGQTRTLTVPDSDGTLALLGLAQTYSAKKTFTPTSTVAGINVGSYAGDPSAPVNGDIHYNSTTNSLRAYINGAFVSLGAGGGGGTPAGSNTQIQFNNSGAFGGSANLTWNGSTLGLGGQFSSTLNSSASTPSAIFSGTWFTGGTATTTKPAFLLEPSGTTSTNWSTSGTGLGINAPSGFTGNIVDFQLNNANRFSISSAGAVTAVNSINGLGTATAPSYSFSGDLNTGIWSSGADILNFSTNGAERFRVDSSGRILFGRTTSALGTGFQVATSMEIVRHDNTALGTASIEFLRSRGTEGSPTALLSGDSIGEFGFRYHNGSGYTYGGGFGAVRPASGAGADLYFSPNGVEALRLNVSTNHTLSGKLTTRIAGAPTATLAGINVGSVAGDPSTPANGDLWYDSTNNLLRARINGATVSLGAGGGGGSYNESNPILDSTSNELLKFVRVASAVNEVSISNNSTGNAPIIEVTGGDTNASLKIKAKGTGKILTDGFAIDFNVNGTGTIGNVGLGGNSLNFTNNGSMYLGAGSGVSTLLYVSTGGFTGSSLQKILDLSQTIGQSGAGGYETIYANHTNSANGSGVRNFLNFLVGSTAKFTVSDAGLVFIANQSAPATPTGGGVLYVESGALKYKGSSGTVTTLGNA